MNIQLADVFTYDLHNKEHSCLELLYWMEIFYQIYKIQPGLLDPLNNLSLSLFIEDLNLLF